VKEMILKFAPVWLQNLAITIYNTYQYKKRHGGVYGERRRYFSWADELTSDEVAKEQGRRLSEFLVWAAKNSNWYRDVNVFDGLDVFPVLEKFDLLQNLDCIATVKDSESIISLTGGTTGASMKVRYTAEDVQERHALLDHFRAGYGYELGKKVAWFSGKSLARDRDLAKGICYRDDWKNNIRFFSTFHVSQQNFDAYWKALNEFSPEFIVGFPSSVYDICMMAKERGLIYGGGVNVFFPTAETVLPMYREVIGDVLGCKVVDQYASSEGAPFILQCDLGKMHIHPLSGVFEVVDSDMKPSKEGEILVTSFTTHGTPLIRYRIGDRVKLASSDFCCGCGSVFPVVDSIDGRSADCVISSENGRVNLGNISNCTKDVSGIFCFQIEQKVLDEILVKVVANDAFDEAQEASFVSALSERVGSRMKISLVRVSDIPREVSGKFRMVKSSL
jgi:phenylacetate-CoA ligase